MTASPSTSERPHRKGLLFCPHCDHASPVDGDWIVHERPARDVYECPDCGGTVTSRRRFGALCC